MAAAVAAHPGSAHPGAAPGRPTCRGRRGRISGLCHRAPGLSDRGRGRRDRSPRAVSHGSRVVPARSPSKRSGSIPPAHWLALRGGPFLLAGSRHSARASSPLPRRVAYAGRPGAERAGTRGRGGREQGEAGQAERKPCRGQPTTPEVLPMNMIPHAARLEAGARPLPSAGDAASALVHAATTLAAIVSQGRAVDARALRAAMEAAFGASDSTGAWVWKDAYEAGEAAQVLFLRRYGSAMQAKPSAPEAMLAMLARVAALLPTQTRRSEESQALQQFSTPLPLGFVASVAAGLTSSDVVLEPSAGTGLLAIFAELAGASLALNELAPTRAGLLERLFATVPISRHNAEQIHDHLPAGVRPSV